MAIRKTLPTPFGVEATYHHVSALQIHYRERVCDVVVSSFLDETARRADCQPLGTLETIRLGFAELGAKTEPGRDAVYAALMARSEWMGAEAV
ncbi:hypothetical protein [Azospirillum argentinense]|uniref:hypothetical protein n=1 Tax=Azospirillum argentinense TaxID=2970906 RepID=UPI0032DEF289